MFVTTKVIRDDGNAGGNDNGDNERWWRRRSSVTTTVVTTNKSGDNGRLTNDGHDDGQWLRTMVVTTCVDDAGRW